jgi:hypothetical protein
MSLAEAWQVIAGNASTENQVIRLKAAAKEVDKELSGCRRQFTPAAVQTSNTI